MHDRFVSRSHGLMQRLRNGSLLTLPKAEAPARRASPSLLVCSAKAIKPHPKRKPTRARLDAIFHKYQRMRLTRMRQIMDFSSLINRVQASGNTLGKLVALYVLPCQKSTQLGDDMAKELQALRRSTSCQLLRTRSTRFNGMMSSDWCLRLYPGGMEC